MIVITTVKDLTLSEALATYVLSADFKTILDLKDFGSNSTNWERIKRQYTLKELRENESLYPNGTVLVKSGTKIELKNSFIKRNPAKKVVPDVFDLTSYKPFLASKIIELFRDPEYVRKTMSSDGDYLASVVNNEVSVYIWCRALSRPNSNAQNGAWLDVSAFVDLVATNKSEVGNFQFTLPPVACEWDDFNGWKITGVLGYDSGNTSDDILSVAQLHKYNDSKSQEGAFKRENLFFNTVLQPNDLVYIKFEKLDLDREVKIGALSEVDIPNQVYDMIGLVDEAFLATSTRSANVTVSGRDMMKVLIEDGSYFFPEQFAQNIFTDENSLLAKRNRIELELQTLAGASYTFKPIETILKFIFNKYSNIGVVPNSVFNGYGDNAQKKKYELKSSELVRAGATQEVNDYINDKFLKEERQGVWRILDLVFDPQIKDRVLADNSISHDNGSLLNSIMKICQKPFVEFMGDTFGDKFIFSVRKQPYDALGYRGMVYDNVISEIESKVGSITDRPAGLSHLVVDIEDVDVYGEPQLGYHDEAYCWYRIIPRGLGVLDEATAFQLAPIVSFDEYAEIWGNKTLTVEYNYSPTEYLMDSDFESEARYAESQTFYDLQFLVQTHQYLPFTRRGVITLTGNRTIKRGMFVYFKPTNEVFHVDQVSHNRSMKTNSRSTVLQVSRGMKEPYIRGVQVLFPWGQSKLVSYFDIINTSVDNNASINNKEFLKNWKVDKDVFNFFVQRRQWAV